MGESKKSKAAQTATTVSQAASKSQLLVGGDMHVIAADVGPARAIGSSALFNFKSLLLVILLLICTSTYVHHFTPGIMDRNKNGYGAIPYESHGSLYAEC
ncbi:uncharacterized protein Triagg1_6543 [Trichoderma aggressivum f. europaeum]|uniref:Protein kish n=1 Tax=Trichoderma aggressivum f. europaeum TaxID=173218 RepID=A0AAE1IDH5_9HYPO|nr:hypothetical protein Triagg1_6543 [Trichoderma aggressivum f. europaeum]